MKDWKELVADIVNNGKDKIAKMNIQTGEIEYLKKILKHEKIEQYKLFVQAIFFLSFIKKSNYVLNEIILKSDILSSCIFLQ